VVTTNSGEKLTMPSKQHQAIVHQLLDAVGPVNPTLAEMRQTYDQILLPFRPVEGTTFAKHRAGGIDVDFVTAPGTGDPPGAFEDRRPAGKP